MSRVPRRCAAIPRDASFSGDPIITTTLLDREPTTARETITDESPREAASHGAASGDASTGHASSAGASSAGALSVGASSGVAAPRGTPLESAWQTACRVARLADEFRGQDVTVLDMRPITPIFDFFVIVSAASPRQMLALAEEVNVVLKKLGHTRLGVEGIEGSTWVLEDFGDVVLHVFHPDTRKLYDLERLWGDAPRVDWRTAATK